ncbi:MAG: histidine kinase [Bacillota bacterium]|nr:histidine kinase [Bacillota bacterium]
MLQNKSYIIVIKYNLWKTGVTMKHAYSTLLVIWLIVGQSVYSNPDIYGIASLLGVLCLFIIKERYIDNKYGSLLFLAAVLLVSIYKHSFILLWGISVLDFMYFGNYIVALLILTAAVWAVLLKGEYDFCLPLLSALLFGYIVRIKENNEKKHLELLDKERRLRYDLERSQSELIRSKEEIEQLVEIRERNRIAHEIHDNIGHSIAGIIFQLEAGTRYLRRDIDKSEGIFRLCSQKLSEALELTRNTVYNIRVIKKNGIEYIEEIIGDFKFCRVSFEHAGDFSRVSALNMKILQANIKEALTNASKYSKASNIELKLDIRRNNIRLFYRDDGVGCSNIKENVGLSGMRTRVRDAGGIISIDGSNGFLIVCNLPVRNEENLDGEKV